MPLYKCTIRPDATDRQKETTAATGPFLVEATDEKSARQLVTANYSPFALRRNSRGKLANAAIWLDKKASDCVPVAEADVVKPQSWIVQGVDLALYYLRHTQMRFDAQHSASMVWWPCRQTDECPV